MGFVPPAWNTVIAMLTDDQTFYTLPTDAQRKAYAKKAGRDVFGLLMAPGTGKTKIEIDDCARLYRAKEVNLVLNFAPNGVHANWAEQIATHLHPDIPRAVATYRAGRSPKALDLVMAQTDVLRFININIEALSHKSGIEFVRKLMRGNRVRVHLDESQRIKTPGAKRTRNAWKVGAEAVSRDILSGTSITQGVENLYGQFRFLDWRILGCRTFAEFKAQYCIEAGPYRKIVGYRNLDELKQRMEPWVFIASLEDCLDLPERTFARHEVELSDEQRRIYNELRTRYVAELDSGQLLEAPMILTRLIRLQQVLAGHVPGEREGEWQPLPCPRLDAVVELAEDIDDKFLVWCQWVPDVVQVVQRLQAAGIGAVPYYGGIPQLKCEENLQRWRQDTGIRALVGTPRKGGIGLTMNEANYAINYSHSYSTEDRIQSLARNYRMGQTRPVHYKDFVAPGTIDTHILAAHRRNQEVAKILDDPQVFRRWLTEEVV